MGLTRKVTSLTTFGLIDFRSDKERAAAYAKGARRQARKQTKLQRRMLDEMREDGHDPTGDGIVQAAEGFTRGTDRACSWLERKTAAMDARTEALKAKRES